MNPIRETVERMLSGSGAFLRCDRGQALYVSNVPVKDKDWPALAESLESGGILCRSERQMLFMTPSLRWREPYTDWLMKQTEADELTRLLMRTQGASVCPEETACWIEGIKRLELPSERSIDDYERLVRQTAAVALRKKCGGLMTVCGLCLNLLRSEQQ